MDQELMDAAAFAPGWRCVCTHQVAALLWEKWRHGRHLESMTSYLKSDSSNRYEFTSSFSNNLAKFHPDPIWNYRALARSTTTRRGTIRD